MEDIEEEVIIKRPVGRPRTKQIVDVEKKPVGRPRTRAIINPEDRNPVGRPRLVPKKDSNIKLKRGRHTIHERVNGKVYCNICDKHVSNVYKHNISVSHNNKANNKIPK